MKVLENYQKNVFSGVPFKSFELPNSPTYNYNENRLQRKCFLCLFQKYSKLLIECLWWNQPLFLRFPTMPRNLTRASSASKSSPSRNSVWSHFNLGFVLTVNTVCNATKNELPTKLLKSILKLSRSVPSLGSLSEIYRPANCNFQSCLLLKLLICNFDSGADVNDDTNIEMSMSRFPNGRPSIAQKS